jgi:hypothetical protein
MLIGTHDATLHQVQQVDIHGTHFFDLVYVHVATPQQRQRARVGAESIYANPQAGDSVRITYLMGVVTGVERHVP